MSVINSTAPIGWNKWSYARNFFQGTNGTVQIPDAPFPYLYTPASGIWAASELVHCLIPWLNVYNAFTTFLIAGGNSGTLIGSIGGLAAVAETFAISVHGQIFGIGRGAEPPQMGYCISNKFKQHVYTRMDVQNTGLDSTITTNKSIELLQNSKFKRALVKYGTVVKYTINKVGDISEYVLTLDFSKDTPPPYVSVTGDKLKITQKSLSGTTPLPAITVDIISIKSNWDIVISKPYAEILAGDYYELNTIWMLEDPYLLSGFWKGTESAVVPSVASSGFDFFVTSHNSPYEEGKFLGFYIWESSNTTGSSATSVIPPQPVTGSSMNDQTGFTWAFGGFGNSTDYPVYPNDTRYRVIQLDAPDADGAMVEYQTRLTVTNADYSGFIALSPTYIRVEIGTGGYVDRHNWYSPCLKGSYIRNDGKLYRILGHVAFNVIDVECISTDGLSSFNPLQNQSYSILNQSAWFINEHYDGRISQGNTGIFRGVVNNISSDKKSFTIQTLGDTFISSVYKSNGKSFINRYQTSVSLPSGFKKRFTKFDGWKLVNNNNEYDIASIDFSSAISTSYTPYPIVVELKNSVSSITLNSNAYISFDSTYDVLGNFSKESGFSLVLDVKAGLSGQTSGFIISDVLCLNGEYVSNPYKIDISPDDMIGFTDGYLFGLAANGSAQSRYSQNMFLTTPRSSIGLSALFHALREEDWIAYRDVSTNNITLRKGSLDFKEYPSKDEVVMGLPTSIQTISTSGSISQVALDQKQERLRRLELKVKDFATGTAPSLTFGIGSYNNIYGFPVSGQGQVDLQTLRIQGIAPGKVPSNTYVDAEGNVVSPVYVYKRSSFQASNTVYVDIGTSTKNTIFIRDGTVSTVLAQYIYDSQVLSNANLVDIVKLRDGEVVMFYGKSMNSFNLYNDNALDRKLNNFRGNGTAWFNSNAVLMLGSFNDAYFWGTPFKAKYGDITNKYLYPLLLMNSVEYVGCLYDSLSESISIFVRAFISSTSYLGSIKISLQTITHNLYECRSLQYNISDASTKTSTCFYRPPVLEDSFISDVNQSWIHQSSDIVQDYYSLTDSDDKVVNDQYIKILGSGCQVNHGGEFGIISAFISYDGTYVICYDSEVGIKSLYSSNQGISWVGSDLVLARNGRCGFVLDGLLFYITESGIMMKALQSTDYSDLNLLATQNSRGNSNTSEEINKQNYLDTAKTVLIGSGSIEHQRLSGYITPEGTVKIFFYDNNNKLKGMESSDRSTWIVSANF